jgi:O-antigen ligase
VKKAGRRQDASSKPNPVLSLLRGILLAPAVLPLLYLPGFHYPYVAPKTFAFRSLGILVLAALLWLVLARVPLRYGNLARRATWIPAMLLAVMYATSLTGLDFQHSFWSTFERGDGLLTATAAALFYYAVLLCAEAGFARRVALVSMWVGNLVALGALVQWLPAQGRVGSTLGNAALMASYLGMTSMLALWFVGEGGRRWRCLVWGGIGLQWLAIVVFSSTRGSMVALGAAGVVAAAYAAWRMQGRVRVLARAALVVVGALLTLFLLFRQQLAAVPFLPLQRIANISPTSGTGAMRVFYWQGFSEAAMQHPLLGVGAEHIDNVYNSFYVPARADEWIDRTHNAYLDYLVQFGIVGALLYLALVLTSLHAASVAARAGDAGAGPLLLFLLVYAVQNVFLFDTALALWLFLVISATLQARVQVVPWVLPVPAIPGALRTICVCAMLALLTPVTILPARANVLLAEAYAAAVPDVSRSAAALAKGLSAASHVDREFGHTVYRMYAAEQMVHLNGDARATAHRTTLGILSSNFNRLSYEARTAAFLAHVIDQTPPGTAMDIGLLERAIARAIRLTPGHVEPWYHRANIDIRRGDAAVTAQERNSRYANAIATLSQYLELRPERPDPRYVIAGLYRTMGDMALAKAWADAGDAAYGRHADEYAARAAGKYYITVNEWAKAASFLQFAVQKNHANHGNDFATAMLLAKVKYLAGDRAGARDILRQLRIESPATIAGDSAAVAEIEAEVASRGQ